MTLLSSLSSLPNPLHEFLQRLIESPLYTPIELQGEFTNLLKGVRQLETQFDQYCPNPKCKIMTPWETVVSSWVQRGQIDWSSNFSLTTQCKRCGSECNYLFSGITRSSIDKRYIEKYGQWPALADFHRGDLDKFDDVTTKEQRDDFNRAIDSASHGFTAGACAYLRRVLESIIEEAKTDFLKTTPPPEWLDKYNSSSTSKKISLLGDKIPSFLSNNKRIYNLLSQGIHSLSDSECSELFPQLRQAIELIFQGRHEVIARARHEKMISDFISQADNPNK